LLENIKKSNKVAQDLNKVFVRDHFYGKFSLLKLLKFVKLSDTRNKFGNLLLKTNVISGFVVNRYKLKVSKDFVFVLYNGLKNDVMVFERDYNKYCRLGFLGSSKILKKSRLYGNSGLIRSFALLYTCDINSLLNTCYTSFVLQFNLFLNNLFVDNKSIKRMLVFKFYNCVSNFYRYKQMRISFLDFVGVFEFVLMGSWGFFMLIRLLQCFTGSVMNSFSCSLLQVRRNLFVLRSFVKTSSFYKWNSCFYKIGRSNSVRYFLRRMRFDGVKSKAFFRKSNKFLGCFLFFPVLKKETFFVSASDNLKINFFLMKRNLRLWRYIIKNLLARPKEKSAVNRFLFGSFNKIHRKIRLSRIKKKSYFGARVKKLNVNMFRFNALKGKLKFYFLRFYFRCLLYKNLRLRKFMKLKGKNRTGLKVKHFNWKNNLKRENRLIRFFIKKKSSKDLLVNRLFRIFPVYYLEFLSFFYMQTQFFDLKEKEAVYIDHFFDVTLYRKYLVKLGSSYVSSDKLDRLYRIWSFFSKRFFKVYCMQRNLIRYFFSQVKVVESLGLRHNFYELRSNFVVMLVLCLFLYDLGTYFDVWLRSRVRILKFDLFHLGDDYFFATYLAKCGLFNSSFGNNLIFKHYYFRHLLNNYFFFNFENNLSDGLGYGFLGTIDEFVDLFIYKLRNSVSFNDNLKGFNMNMLIQLLFLKKSGFNYSLKSRYSLFILFCGILQDRFSSVVNNRNLVDFERMCWMQNTVEIFKCMSNELENESIYLKDLLLFSKDNCVSYRYDILKGSKKNDLVLLNVDNKFYKKNLDQFFIDVLSISFSNI